MKNMAEEELDLELNDEQENINRVEKRIKSLSEKVELTAEERDEKARLLQENEGKLALTSKERDFYKGFNSITTKYPGASEYQDKILEKVNAGYDVEDATISILAKEGKYTPTAPKLDKERVAGGSASTAMSGNDSKTPKEMTQDERRAQLLELESQGGLNL
jgi:hypothetical protein